MTKQDTTELSRCGDCGVVPGGTHVPGCDVERCPGCGMQRIQCDEESHQVMPDSPWTGLWPGVVECQEFGWYARFVPNGKPSWRETTGDDPEATEDLNRLAEESAFGHLTWDRDQLRWVKS